jgi:hypothetical protein
VLQEIRHLIDENSGEVPLYIRLRSEAKEEYFLCSRTLKVHPNSALIEELRDKIGHNNVWISS